MNLSISTQLFVEFSSKFVENDAEGSDKLFAVYPLSAKKKNLKKREKI